MTQRSETLAGLARAAGKHIGSDVREMGEVRLDAEPPLRTPADEALAARARDLLREEVARVARMREQYAVERAQGAPASSSRRLDALAANLEGASRFALRMGLLTPGEARQIWHEARAAMPTLGQGNDAEGNPRQRDRHDASTSTTTEGDRA